MGFAAIAIFFFDVTKKIKTKLNEKMTAEKVQQAKHAENFTSTVSHEMRTPLGSMLFFIGLIEALLDDMPQTPELKSTKQYIQHIKTQLKLMQVFVGDLLDMR